MVDDYGCALSIALWLKAYGDLKLYVFCNENEVLIAE